MHSVTVADYRVALEKLLRLCSKTSFDGMAAAQVLLSLLDGSNYHIDLTDLD
jgi:hypothetical protein